MPNSSSNANVARSEVVASMLVAMIESKNLYTEGGSSVEKAANLGEAFKALYQAVKQAEGS